MTMTTQAKMEQAIRWDWKCIRTSVEFLQSIFKRDGRDTVGPLLYKANQIMAKQDTLIGFHVTLSAAECCPSLYSVLELWGFRFCVRDTRTRRPPMFQVGPDSN